VAVKLAALRQYVIAQQGYVTRFRRATADDVVAEIRRLQCVQLDSISAVERSHRLALTSRIGAYPAGTVSRLLGEGRIFEYWAHEACLLHVDDFPLFKRRMHDLRVHHWLGNEIDREPELRERVLGEIRERGPLPARAFEGRGDGGMWNWKPAKRMLEALFAAGELVVAGRAGFQRLYELPERVIPKRVLDAPTPSEDEFRRAYILRAIEARGALTDRGVTEHCRFEGGAAGVRAYVDQLVAEGVLRRLEVEDGGPTVVVAAEAELDGAPTGAVLISPFDNLLWDRDFARRVLRFDHVIEVYKRAHERMYGYYVLPLVVGDRIVGRADLKAERAEGVLRLKAFHREPGIRAKLDEPLERALARLARTLGLAAYVK